MLQIDAGGRPVVLAGGVDRRRIAKAALIGVERLGREAIAGLAPGGDLAFQVIVRIGADQPLRQVEGLDQEEPVIIGGGEGPVGPLVHGMGGRDVEQGSLLDALRVVERQAVGDPGAAVVADHGEALEAERGHDLHLVLGHRSLGIVLVPHAAVRLAGLAVAAQVRKHDREALGQAGRDLVPHDVGLRIAVQQEQGGTAAGPAQEDLGARGSDPLRVKAVQHHPRAPVARFCGRLA